MTDQCQQPAAERHRPIAPKEKKGGALYPQGYLGPR
eukprot:CAMPEP_0197453458 /NCGR_PEP_ID=MMETSP1175-20131217/34970_1 /TAXON_ID=1003142 /ORGANISM="Triceratium dubium, Strain CCMP147" /LENGTH=35 /DNA_ID= /DNA_START= /DNA_END= /DNA_ORIENTATION=